MGDDVQFTDRELDLMSILWKLGSGTVTEVRDRLRDEPGYTSVLKMLQVLEEKGHVRHEIEGRAYRYFPTVGSEAAGRSALGKIVDKIFHGSAELTLARLVEERPISGDELERMRGILDELARERKAKPKGGGIVNVMVLAAYTLAVALVLAASACLLEWALTSLHLPVRWVWIAALGLSVWLPLAAFVSGPGQEGTASSTGVLSIGAPAPQAANQDGTIGGGEDKAATAFELLIDWRAGVSRALATGVTLLPPISLAAAWIAGIWSAASFLVAMILFVSILRLNRRASRWPNETLLGRPVKVSPDLGPATVGLFTPVIVIPRWAKELPPPELELVLRHEGEHVDSRDTLLLALGLLAVVACPWNPLIWWQLRRLKAAVEVDCDRRVLRKDVQPAQYGNLLVRVGSRGRVSSLAVPTIAGSTSLLERRLTIMKKLQGRISLRSALPATALALLLMVVACTTEAPVATEQQADSEAAPLTNGVDPAEPQEELVANVKIDEDGTVQVNGVVHSLDRVAELVAPLYAEDAVVSLEAHEAAPYQVVATLQEQLREAGLLRVVFTRPESGAPRSSPRDRSTLLEAGAPRLSPRDRSTLLEAGAPRSSPRDMSTLLDAGLAVVLPATTMPDMSEIKINPRNLLFVEVLPSGDVEIRHGEDPSTQRMLPQEVEALCREGKALNPSSVVIVRTQPEAEYTHMYEVLDAIQRAGCTRFSLQLGE